MFLTCPYCTHVLVQVLQDAAGGVQLLQLLLLEAAALELVDRVDHALDLGLVLRGTVRGEESDGRRGAAGRFPMSAEGFDNSIL